MTWVLTVLLVLLVGAVAVLVAERGGASLPPAYDDRPDVVLPDGPLTGDDLRGLRLNTAVRGYRADEVDALLERLAAELDARHEPPTA
ncbi:DivIVA domain-containing protein [Nocardioides aurantiacus]|uniref:DivIVA domain-containing protein n=1 Tax=Nocardioides aurantiacus TaxID=86796 RepID=UPI00403F9344